MADHHNCERAHVVQCVLFQRGGLAPPLTPPPVSDAARIHPLLLILTNAFLSIVSIAALVGIWFAASHG
jgi:hypothetical protein